MGNILIIGASSLAARYIAKKNSASGHTVYGISRSLFKDKCYERVSNSELEFRDVLFNKIFIISSRLPNEGGKTEEFLHDNLSICYLALSYAKKNFTKVIFFSSFSVYDKKESIVDFDSKLTNNDAYGISKLVCEKYLQDSFDKVLILRIPVFLYSGVVGNFLAKLKKQIYSGGYFEFSHLKSKVNAFFSIDDLQMIDDKYECGLINCQTLADWTIYDLAEYSVSCGLGAYKEVASFKEPQIVINTCGIEFTKTSTAIKNFING